MKIEVIDREQESHARVIKEDHYLSSPDEDIDELKKSQKRLEAEIAALIERSPAYRSVKIERLRTRERELLAEVVAHPRPRQRF